LQNHVNQTKQKRGKKVSLRSVRLEINLVAPDAYPDLKENPTNLYSQMSDKERLQGFVETMSLIWAETCRERAKVKPDSKNGLSRDSRLRVAIT